MKIEAWSSPGDSWGEPWEPFWLPGAPETTKKRRMAKNGPRMGPHLEGYFRPFSIFWDTFFEPFFETPGGRLQVLIFNGFWSVLEVFFSRFFVDFPASLLNVEQGILIVGFL